MFRHAMAKCHHVMAKKTDGDGNLVDAMVCQKCGVVLKVRQRRAGVVKRRRLLK